MPIICAQHGYTIGLLGMGTRRSASLSALLAVHGGGKFGADQVGSGTDRVDGKVRVTCRCHGLTATKELTDHWKAHARPCRHASKAVAEVMDADIREVRLGAYTAAGLLQVD